jgi:Na+-transporting methylmalonyl-CoA/oxaloacetate decarboxylase beta subunit
MKITETYENLPKIIKVLLQIFLGAIVSGVYRVIRFLETKNIVTLVVGIVSLVTGGLFGILWVVDLVTEIFKNRITVLAD